MYVHVGVGLLPGHPPPHDSDEDNFSEPDAADY
jgi:hypothetical protein